MKTNHGYQVNIHQHECTGAYSFPDDIENWLPCPHCHLKPKVWTFNNGRSTACGCGNSIYDHFSVYAESIMSVHIRCNGSTKEYDVNELRKNWNDYCMTYVNPCSHYDLRQYDKW